MIRWTQPELLVLGLGLVLVLVLMTLRHERRRRWALVTFAGPLAKSLAHAEGETQRRIRWSLRILALALLSVAAAVLRWARRS